MESKVDPPRRRRILALDGGGIRGLFTVEVLGRMESLLRAQSGRADLVLADHFDLISGTSTGAIIAALLSWGAPVDEVRALYVEHGEAIFRKAPIWQWMHARFQHQSLAELLRGLFCERDGTPALLGSQRLRTRLLLMMRNAGTGSAWPVTNNPEAKYNRLTQPDGSPEPACNLLLPIWQLVRASTAAPTFFLPERITLGDTEHVFVDGGVTPYNNPAFIAFLTATEPAYGLQWPTGVDRLHLISIGTLRRRSGWMNAAGKLPTLIGQAGQALNGLIETVSLQQDLTCRVLGECRFGEILDSEIGDLMPSGRASAAPGQFSYVRYNRLLSSREIEEVAAVYGTFALHNVRLLPYLLQEGRRYAEEHVKPEHLS